MYFSRGRFCSLTELTSSNEFELFSLMSQNSDEYQRTVSHESIPSSNIAFQQLVKRWFSSGRNYQFLVYDCHGYNVGTVFFYAWDKYARKIKCSCFFVPRVKRRLVVSEALGLSMVFATSVLGATNIIFDVYEDNCTMINLATKLGAYHISSTTSSVDLHSEIRRYLLYGDALECLLAKLYYLEKKRDYPLS